MQLSSPQTHPSLYIQVTETDKGPFYGRAFRKEEINWGAQPPPGVYYLRCVPVEVRIQTEIESSSHSTSAEEKP